MSYKIGVRIPDKKVWEEFREFVFKKHKQKHSILGIELSEALKLYMEYEGKNPNDIQETSDKDKDKDDIEKAREMLRNKTTEHEKLDKTEIHAIIYNATNRIDSRQVNDILRILEGNKEIQKLINDQYMILPKIFKENSN